ncbi:hypothetical protein D3C74_357600 [compost metagenome]
MLFNQMQYTMQMHTCFRMNSNYMCSRFCECRDVLFRIFNHEMHIKRQLCQWSNRSHNERAKRKIWYKMSIHDIDMNPIGSAALYLCNLFSQLGKIR